MAPRSSDPTRSFGPGRVVVFKVFATVLSLALGFGCNERSRSGLPEGLELPPGTTAEDHEQGVGYPTGPWWRADEELGRVRLAARHILISHRDVQGPAVLFGAAVRPHPRARRDALRLVTALAYELDRGEASFEDLARRYSNEPVSARVGGNVGVFGVDVAPESFVDALGNLQPQAVSSPIESDAGFHLVQRLEIPAPVRVSVSRIVIGHRDAPLILTNAARARSREQAEALAQRLWSGLRSQPERFDRVARDHSDGGDAERAGDVGSWNTHEGGAPSVLLERARRLDVGAISEIFETEMGFEWLRRTRDRARERYGVTDILVRHRDAPIQIGPTTLSRADAARLADEVQSAVDAGGSFDDVAETLCTEERCGVRQYVGTDGRGVASVEVVTLGLKVGETADRPVESAFGFHVLRRTEATVEQPARPVRFDLPEPKAPATEDIVRALPGPVLASVVRRLGDAAPNALRLPPADGAFVRATYSELADHFETDDDIQRLEHLQQARASLRERLGDTTARRVQVYMRSNATGAKVPEAAQGAAP